MYKQRLLTNCFALLFSVSSLFSQSLSLVKDLNPGTGSSFTNGQTGIKSTIGDLVFFIATPDGASNQLMCSDGTESGTLALLPAYSPNDVSLSDFVVKDSLCWFIQKTPAGTFLFSSDGTPQGTAIRHQSTAQMAHLTPFKDGFLCKKIVGGFNGDQLLRFTPADSTLTTIGTFNWFSGLLDFTVTASDTIYAIGGDDNGRNLYKSDGAPLSLQVVRQINTGSEFNQWIYLTPVGNKVYFFWQNSGAGEDFKLWVSDGTSQGTLGLKAFETPDFMDLRAEKALLAYNNKFFFRAKSTTDGKGFELYVSDGTVAGTKLVKDTNTGNADGSPQNLTIYQGKLWFTGRNSNWNPSLWYTTGTNATAPMSNFGYSAIGLTTFQDSLVMVGYTDATGTELFFTPGTQAGTRAVSDLNVAGSESVSYATPTPAQSQLYLLVTNAATTGKELWVYRPGTSGVQELQAGIAAQLSPNPANAYVLVQSAEATRLQVFNAFGLLVEDRPFRQSESLNTANWPAGNYLVLLSGNSGSTVKMLAIAR